MKKILFFSIYFFVLQHNYGQDTAAQKSFEKPPFVRNLKWWQKRELLASFDNDVDTLSSSINNINVILKNYKTAFDDYRNNVTGDFKNACKNDTSDLKSCIQSIQNRSFYQKGLLSQDSSFLYYYTNKELNNYLESLNTINTEMEKLCRPGNLNAFSSNNFLNAYYYMSESGSLLLAAMDNLERYYSLGSIADAINDTSISINETSNITQRNIAFISDTLHKVDSVGLHSDTLLANTFTPYYKNKKEF